MAKRFTDTDKWKKPFIRGLQGAYKLLWLYILDDCDHAGIWQVDFEVARIRIGEQIDREQAISAFGDRIEIFNNGSKWFLRDFIDFQYGQLNEKNRMHLSVINILDKNEIGAYKALPRGQGYIQGQGKGQGKGQGTIQGQPDFDFEFKTAFDEKTLEGYERKYKHKGLDVAEQLKSFRLKCDNDRGSYYTRSSSTLRTNFQYQLDHAKPGANGKAGQSSHEQTKNKLKNA